LNRRARAVVVSAWIALALSSGARLAEAGDGDRAASLAKDASAAYDRGEYRRAAELFEQAHGLDPAPSLEVNAAQAWRLAGELGRASDAYALALAAPAGSGGLAKADRAFAQQKLDELLKSVATLSIDEPRGGTATVAHVTGAAIPVVVHLSAGRHEVVIRNPDGAVVRREIELGKGERRTVSIVSEKTGPSPSPAATSTVTTPAPAPPAHEAPEQKSGIPAVRIAGVVALGTAAVLGGVTAYLGVRTLDAVDRWDKDYPTNLDAHDEATRLKTATNILVAVTAVTAAAGVLMLVIPVRQSADRGSTRLTIRADRAVLTTTF